MLQNVFRMTKTSAKLLLRSKAFLVFGLLLPVLATLMINLWYKIPKTEKKEEMFELTSLDEQMAYQVDFNRFPVKIYDCRHNEDSEKICKKIHEAGMFQVFRVDASDANDEEILESAKSAAMEDKVGAILVLKENQEDSTLYSAMEDKRFELLQEFLPYVFANPSEADSRTTVTYVKVDAEDEVNFGDISSFAYCLAISTIAFIFGGVLIVNIVLSEKQDHVYSRILLTTANRAGYLISKIMISVGLTLFQTVTMTVCFRFFVNHNLNISAFQFFVLLFLEGIIFNLISLCIGMFTNSVVASSFIAFTVWSISALLAGTYFDISGAGDTFKKVSLIMPQRWAMLAVTRLQRGNSTGYTLIICATLTYCVILLAIGLLGMKFSEDE